MSDAMPSILGPLVIPECRRAVGRGWLILVRMLAAVAFLGVVVSVIWWWWTATQFEAFFSPFSTLRTGLYALVGLELFVVLIMTPALLAGSLAGEKERGSLGLLLTTRVSSREIVAGRIVGKLTQIGSVVLAGLPGLILLAALAGIRLPALLTMIALPLAVGFGVAGLAGASSALSRRGRDALLVVYLLLIFAGLAQPLAAAVPAIDAWTGLSAIFPFHGLGALTWDEDIRPASGTIAVWTAIGLAGCALASWRLRPACLRLIGGEMTSKRGRRRLWVPPIGERPMLWKELYIERAGSLGKAGKWLGLMIVFFLFAGSSILAANVAWYLWYERIPAVSDQYRAMLGDWYADRWNLISGLIQLAVGLRAAVAIASERERGTWDGLLTSTLEGKEIVRGKLWGSLFALRWLFVAAFWAWTVTLAAGAMRPFEYSMALLTSFIIAAFTAAFGVRVSLEASTATKSMAVTVGIWLGALLGFLTTAALLSAVMGMAAMTAWDQAYQYGLVSQPGGPFILIRVYGAVWWPSFLGLYVAATLIVLSETRLRFDRISGRMAGDETAVKVDRMIHGMPMAPIAIGRTDQAPAEEASAEVA